MPHLITSTDEYGRAHYTYSPSYPTAWAAGRRELERNRTLVSICELGGDFAISIVDVQKSLVARNEYSKADPCMYQRENASDYAELDRHNGQVN